MPTENPHASIRELSAQIVECLNARDHEGAAALYLPDGTLLPPGSPAVVGRPAITAFWHQASAAFADVSIEVRVVEPCGPDIVVEEGVLSLNMRGVPQRRATGKYLVIWARTPSGWRISRDIWNMDA